MVYIYLHFYNMHLRKSRFLLAFCIYLLYMNLFFVNVV